MVCVAVSGAVTIYPAEPSIAHRPVYSSVAVSGAVTIDPAELSSRCGMTMMAIYAQQSLDLERAASAFTRSKI